MIYNSQKSPRAEWINKIWFITLMGYYSALRKEILTQVLTWITIKGIMLRKISPSQKDNIV